MDNSRAGCSDSAAFAIGASWLALAICRFRLVSILIGNGGVHVADNHKLLKAIKDTIGNFSTLGPMELVEQLRNPSLIAKMKKYGVNDAQIHRVILILQEHKPNSKEFVAYLNSSLV